MNNELVSLLNGAGIGDILIPRKDFIREHRHIVNLLNRFDSPLLRNEAKKQKAELKRETGVGLRGGNLTSNLNYLARAVIPAGAMLGTLISTSNLLPGGGAVLPTGAAGILTLAAQELLRYYIKKSRETPTIPPDPATLATVENLQNTMEQLEENSNNMTEGDYLRISNELMALARNEDRTAIIPPLNLPELKRRKDALNETVSVRNPTPITNVAPPPLRIIRFRPQVAPPPLRTNVPTDPDTVIEMIENPIVRRGGFGKASGFIRRLMAENALKHKGQYQKPTFPLAKGSTMNKPAEFDYRQIANSTQRGNNQSEYGASPFIQKHFGFAKATPFERKRGTPYPTEPFTTKRKAKKQTQESEQQREARKTFIVDEPVAEPVVETRVESDKYSKEALAEYIDTYFKYANEPIKEFRPQKGGVAKGSECIWFGLTGSPRKMIDPPFKIKPGFDLRTVINTRGSGNTSIPINECVLKDGNTIIKIDRVIAPNLREGSDGWNFTNYTGDIESISITLTSDSIKETVRDERYNRSITRNKPISFYFKPLFDLQHNYYIGLNGALINYGPKETFKPYDSRHSMPFNRESKQSEEAMKQSKESIDKGIANIGRYGKYTLTINGAEYVSDPPE